MITPLDALRQIEHLTYRNGKQPGFEVRILQIRDVAMKAIADNADELIAAKNMEKLP